MFPLILVTARRSWTHAFPLSTALRASRIASANLGVLASAANGRAGRHRRASSCCAHIVNVCNANA